MPTVFMYRPTPASLEAMGTFRRFLMIWAPAFVGMAIIATESTPTFSSANTSHWLRPIAERFYGHLSNRSWEQFHHLLRKTGHFSFYGLLCLLFMRGWLLTYAHDASLSTTAWRLRSWTLGLVSTFAIASADEFHQSFLPSRTGLFSDVVLDTCGGLFVSSLVMGISWCIRHSRDRSAHQPAVSES